MEDNVERRERWNRVEEEMEGEEGEMGAGGSRKEGDMNKDGESQKRWSGKAG